MAKQTDRRSFLNKTLLGAAGAGAAFGLEERILMAAIEDGDAAKQPPKPDTGESMPTGQIGKVKISRLILGGNLIGGWAHSRDLMYVSRLFKEYNTEAKIFQTLELAEQWGINTIQIDPANLSSLEKYRKERGGKIQMMICMGAEADEAKTRDQAKFLVDHGADLLYTHGQVADGHAQAGHVDILGKAIEIMKAQGVPAGIGGHSLETTTACEKNNLNPDFYVKTLHMDRYWSATPKENREEWCWYKPQSSEHGGFHDNMWCLDPEKTVAFMESVTKPWAAFKVMAAGAIPPQVGFSYAFRNGADFVVAGMFDFQIAVDAELAKDSVRKAKDRKRPWRA
ncbi:MAG: hypothetical protein ACYC35_09615 [Pirellulales bacterium]